MSLRRRNTLLLLLAIALVLFGTVWSPVSGPGRWTDVVLTSGHGVAFALTAALAALVLRDSERTSSWPVWMHYCAAFVITGLLGFGSEALQIWLPRDATLEDLNTDLLGAWGGLAAFAVFDTRLRTLGRIGLPFSGLFPFFVLAIPLVVCIQAYARREAAFPNLADYRVSFDDYFLQALGTSRAHTLMPEAWAGFQGERAMQLTFGTGAWLGIHFAELSPNWQNYSELVLDVTNPNNAELPLHLSVQDRAHNYDYSDRFNRTLTLPPSQRTVVRVALSDIEAAPRTRQLDSTEIASLFLVIEGSQRDISATEGLFLSRLWLE